MLALTTGRQSVKFFLGTAVPPVRPLANTIVRCRYSDARAVRPYDSEFRRSIGTLRNAA